MKGHDGQDFKAPKYLMLFVTLHVFRQSLIGAESHWSRVSLEQSLTLLTVEMIEVR